MHLMLACVTHLPPSLPLHLGSGRLPVALCCAHGSEAMTYNILQEL